MNQLLSTALNWISQGFSVIPVKFYSKRPAIKSWEPYQKQQATEQELQQWFRSTLTNIAIITGWQSLTVIDFDIQDVFDYWYSLYPINTYMVKTSRGMHVYLQTKATNYHSDLLDIKAERGYVLIPPSFHPSGYQYQVFNSAPILKVDNLSDVLPPEFTPMPDPIVKTSLPITENHFQLNDPWDTADQAVELTGAVDKIRRFLPLLSYFPQAEKTSRDGRWWVTLCPFHVDKNPSFWIDMTRGLCGCHKCNIKEMDVVNLHARLNKISNRDAIIELARIIHIG